MGSDGGAPGKGLGDELGADPAARRAESPGPSARRRVPLGSNRKRLSYEFRLRMWIVALAAPTVVCSALLAWWQSRSLLSAACMVVALGVVYLYAGVVMYEQLTRPLQTLSNVVAALREDDYSFRARGARRGDSLGDLALEVNSLAGTLQWQSSRARDALTLAEHVMRSMRAPVLAFASDGRLRVLNPAAESAFALSRETALGRKAEVLGLESLFLQADGTVHVRQAISGVAGETRWSLRRSTFRLGGVPHTLFVLSDVDAALREEERVAWQRLIRVLSHEINNSLTPITSLASSLRARLPAPDAEGRAAVLREDETQGLRRGLHLIEDRAFSLHRFVQAYQQLTRLPRPVLQRVSLRELVLGVVALETRARVTVRPGVDVELPLDPAQMEQLLINLVRNAVEAALGVEEQGHVAEVGVWWSVAGPDVVLAIEDNGPGLTDTANLFVPFYTTKPGGSGIGLVLAQQIAQAHGGSLRLVNRRAERGCVAELHLPPELGSA